MKGKKQPGNTGSLASLSPETEEPRNLPFQTTSLVDVERIPQIYQRNTTCGLQRYIIIGTLFTKRVGAGKLGLPSFTA